MTTLTLTEAEELARQGIKVTHTYFTPDEWLIMKGNLIIFEDGSQIYMSDWSRDKSYLLSGWSIYKE